ncbi:MAG: DUF4190 domain-containing protein [Micrococcales bacterium]|nr:DUF4190 domain-containing protein [Micrococcales bacterium]
MSQTPPPLDATPPVPPAPHPGAQVPASPSAPVPPHHHPAASQPEYGQTAYAGATYAPSASPSNILAIVSLVCSLAGLFFWFVAPVAGIITGHIALSQIKRTGQQGRGMALAGVIVGYSLAGLTVIGIVIYVIVIAVIFAGLGAACSADPFSCS